jgi:hypothetical protein
MITDDNKFLCDICMNTFDRFGRHQRVYQIGNLVKLGYEHNLCWSCLERVRPYGSMIVLLLRLLKQ